MNKQNDRPSSRKVSCSENAVISLILKNDLLHRRELREKFHTALSAAGERQSSVKLYRRGCWEVVLCASEAYLTDTPTVVSDLCLMSTFSESTVKNQIRNLEKSGLIVKYADENDRRRKFVELTKPYREILDGFVLECAEEFKDLIDYHDKRERDTAIGELRSYEELFRAITSAARDGIFVIDDNGATVFVNEAAEKMFGFERKEILGKPLHKLIVCERYYYSFLKGFAKFKKSGDGQLIGKTHELPLQRMDGTEFYADHSFSSVKLRGKWHAIATIRDTKERKVSEADIIASKEENEIANRAKSEFLANMSHEIRTPMNGVIGMVEILTQMEMQPEQERMIRTIRNSSFSLLRIIDDILDASKIEAGELKLEHVPVQLSPVIEAAVETLIPTADLKKVRLSLFIDQNLPNWIHSDNIRLRQILLNLLSNAVKFSPKKAGDRSGHVDLCAELTSDGKLQFTVTDNGIGITENVRSRLFKPFSQGEESTTRQFGGTGLGLVITRNLLEMMGGTISVDSTPGEGATFTVTLPVDEAEGGVMPANLSGLKYFGLIDNRMQGDRAVSYLEHTGSTVRFADNEKQLAAWVASEDGPVIVLLARQTSEENDLIKNALSDGSGRVRFLKFTSQRSDKFGLIDPDCYVIQRFPVLPSDLLRAVRVLSGQESPESDLASVEQAAPAGAVRIVKAGSAKPLILLAEDNETNQEVIIYQLDILGYAVEVAEDGQKGLELYKTGRFDLVLSDCHMPVMDGFEMTNGIRKIERQNGSPRVPIIAITANALQGADDICLAAGMDDYLSKPVELERLGQMLRRWLPEDGGK